MVLEVVCHACGAILYIGLELKSPREVLKASGGHCGRCGATLSQHDFTVEIEDLGEGSRR